MEESLDRLEVLQELNRQNAGNFYFLVAAL